MGMAHIRSVLIITILIGVVTSSVIVSRSEKHNLQRDISSILISKILKYIMISMETLLPVLQIAIIL